MIREECDPCQLHFTAVINSRCRNNYIIRRRECPVCGKRFTTYEIRVDNISKGSGNNGLESIINHLDLTFEVKGSKSIESIQAINKIKRIIHDMEINHDSV